MPTNDAAIGSGDDLASPLCTPRDVRIAAAIALAGTAAYGLLPTSFHMHDALGFAQIIDTHRHVPVFHAYHLLHLPLVQQLANLLGFFGADPGAMRVGQAVSTVAAGAGMGLFYLLGIALTGKRLLSGIATAGLAGSYGYWYFGTEMEVYATANALMLATMLAALWCRRRLSAGRCVCLGLVYAVALLAYSVNVLFAPAVALPLLWTRESWSRRIRAAAVWAATTFLGVAIPYTAYFWHELHCRGEYTFSRLWALMTWGFGCGVSDYPGGARLLEQFAVGAGRTLLGGYFKLRLWGASADLEADFAAAGLGNHVRLAEHLSPAAAVFGVAGTAVVAACLAALGVGAILGGKALWREKRFEVCLLAVWIVPFFLAFIRYQPHNIEFWNMLLCPFWAGAAVALAHFAAGRPRFRVALAAVLAGGVLGVNLVCSVLLQVDPQHNQFLVRARALESRLKPDDVVLQFGATESLYLVYFGRRESIDVLGTLEKAKWNGPQGMTAVYDQARQARDRGQAIYVSSRLFDKRRWQALAGKTGLSAEDVAEFLRFCGGGPAAIELADGETLHLLPPGKPAGRAP